MPLQISQAQVQRFNDDGFLVLDSVIEQGCIEPLRASFHRLFRGEFETGITPDEVNWQQGSGDPTLTRQICNGWRADRIIAEVLTRPDFGEAIARLADWPGTRIMIDNVLWKPAGARPLGYHQDSAYLDWFYPSSLVSLWIALDDTSKAGGTIEFARGSHRWRRSEPSGEFHGPEDYQRGMRLAAGKEGVAPDIVHVEVPRGGGSFHHGWLWHGSGDNRGDRPRRSLVLHAMRCDAEFNPDKLQQGIGRIYGRYKHLADNHMDENYFPITWRHDGYRTTGIQDFIRSVRI